jgi:NAD-dependent deacetylase
VIKIRELAHLIQKSKHTVVLTGAGISTGSGIPDFRGPTGLWKQVDPLDALSVDAFYRDPKRFYQFYFHMLSEFSQAKPNPAHFALAQLEKRGFVQTVHTQNIDELHQRAGTKNILEIHGTSFKGRCLNCGHQQLLKPISSLPLCEQCKGLVRPMVVLFGDPMPEDYLLAEEEAYNADLALVVGSSLQVSPACYLPLRTQEMAIINLEPTPYDDKASFVLHQKAEEALPTLMQFLDLEAE